jgi:glucokinase
MSVIVGDIGGTSSRLAWFEGETRLAERTYASRDFTDFSAVVRRFIDETGARARTACFAMAGPVRHGVCTTTNLPWPAIEEQALAAQTGLPHVRLVNDFVAQTMGIVHVREGEFCELLPGELDPTAPIGVIGAGTGLGEAIAVRGHDGSVTVVAGEGGHADFAPTDERQIMVLRELRKLLGQRVSYEHVLSGPGLHNVYRALARGGWAREEPAISEALANSADPAATIAMQAQRGQDALCVAALEVFVEVYAQEASNMALRALCFGGVYLAGGIAPKILDALRSSRFEQRFRDKPPHQALLRSMTVRVVLDTQLGLRGAAKIAEPFAS